MSKIINFKMGNFMYDLASKPIRTKREMILLVLNTIRVIGANVIIDAPKGKIALKVDRMSRLFYEVEDKMFSVQFPFSIEIKEKNTFRIYDNQAGVDIDSKMISLLISVFGDLDLKIITFEDFFTELYQVADESEDVEAEVLWKLIKQMTLFEVGYLRYDYDQERQNGKLHPLNHLDINYEPSCTYKIGLRDKIKMNQLMDVVDITSECSFLNI